jgi:hypothetical protein
LGQTRLKLSERPSGRDWVVSGLENAGTKRLILSTLMSAITRCGRVNSWLSSKRLFWALSGKAGGAVVETTIDHTLMRGSEPHDR